MTLAGDLRGIGAIWIREYKIFTRETSRVVSAIATPLLWLAFFGTGMAGTIPPEAIGDVSYSRYIFPGLVAQAVLFGTVFYGLYIIWDRRLDVLKAVLVAPVSRTAVFLGKVAGGTTESLFQASIVLLVGSLVTGASLLGALPALGIVLLFALGFVSFGLAMGTRFESLEGFQAIVTFLLFPLFFLSGAIFPLHTLPPWLEIPTRLNPMTYAVDALRQVLVGVGAFPLWLDLAVLVVFDLVMIAVGVIAFRRMR